MKSCKSALVFLLPALYATIGSAWAAEEVLGPEAMAMGGAAAASSGDNSGVTVNPGLIALDDRYDLGGFFAYGDGGGRHWGIQAVDARTVRGIALGIAYSGDRYEGALFPGDVPGWQVPGQPLENHKRTDDFALAVAFPMLDRRLSVGVNAAMSLYDHDRLGSGVQFNADVGLGFQPIEAVTLGVVARNVLPIEGLGDRRFGLLGGLRLADDAIGAIEVDGGWTALDDLTGDAVDPWTIAVGAEKTLGEYLSARAGFRRDGVRDRRDVTFGLGAVGGGGALSIGVAVPVGMGPDTLRGMTGTIGLTVGVPDPHAMDF